METEKKFTVIAVKWFDKVNGNTYHSVQCIRHKDGAKCYGAFTYGYGSSYEETALNAMNEAGWLGDGYYDHQLWRYERENNYPIIWVVRNGLKRECVANGKKG